MMLDGTEYFECQCGAAEHTIRFVLDLKEDQPEIYTEVFMNNTTFLKRIWRGLKYIVGIKCSYGYWDVWILNRDDVYRLRHMCTRLIEVQNKKTGG